MKKNRTMMLALFGVAACSFCFGLGQHEVPASVPNCQNCCCEDLYSWWINGVPGGNVCFSAQVFGATWVFVAGDNTTNAIPAVFDSTCHDSGCKVKSTFPKTNYDRWTWPQTSYTCDINPLTGRPTPEFVTPGGTPTFDSTINRLICAK
jgi:hypothetical protein